MRRLTNAEFIAKAKEVHGDKYVYERIEYKRASEKVDIVCEEHGVFKQTPNKHLMGRGCPTCADIIRADKKRDSPEEVIEKFRQIHGDLYDYSKMIFIRHMSKVEVICKLHGSFWVTPNHHITGTGCPECGKRKNKGGYNPQKKKFFYEANKKFGDKFKYVKETYISIRLSMDIICQEHGRVTITPLAHLDSDSGCWKCDSDKELIVGRKCSKCGELKPLTEYYNFSKDIHGRYTTCIKCVKNDMESECRWETYGTQLLPCDRPTDIDGMLWVVCKRCGKMLQPTVRNVRARIYASAKGRGDSNFYCSDECKGSCAIFGKVKYPTYLMKPEQKRDCHKTIKKALVKNQCDEVGYQYCERCGDIISTDMHHVIEVAKHGTEKAYEPAAMMVLCVNCHRIVHSQCK